MQALESIPNVPGDSEIKCSKNSIFSFLFFIIDTITNALTSCPPLPTSIQPSPHLSSGHHHTVVCVHGSCIYDLWLILSPSFIQPLPGTAVSLFHVSTPLFLFCSSLYFIHQIPHIGETIWHLPFSDWFISLSIIISRSIHAVAKGKSSFFFAAT